MFFIDNSGKKINKKKFLHSMGADPDSEPWNGGTEAEVKMELVSYACALSQEYLYATVKMAASMHEWQTEATGYDARPDVQNPFVN